MKDPRYPSSAAFRQALESRISRLARAEGVDIQRIRRQLAFDRLLARLFLAAPNQWILKGGYALELRLEQSRTTRDIDLAVRQPLTGDLPLTDRLLQHLQTAAALDVEDYFEFVVGEPSINL